MPLFKCESLLYPFQAVAGVEDDRREQNIEEDLRVKGHLSHRRELDGVTFVDE